MSNYPNEETLELMERIDALHDLIEDVEAMLNPSMYSRSTAEHRLALRLDTMKDLACQCQAIMYTNRGRL